MMVKFIFEEKDLEPGLQLLKNPYAGQEIPYYERRVQYVLYFQDDAAGGTWQLFDARTYRCFANGWRKAPEMVTYLNNLDLCPVEWAGRR